VTDVEATEAGAAPDAPPGGGPTRPGRGDAGPAAPPHRGRGRRGAASDGDEPVRMAYGLVPRSTKGRLVFGAVYVLLMLVAVAIVGRGPTGAIDVEGTEVDFGRTGADGGLPTAGQLGAWTYTGGSWVVDQGAAGQAAEAGVTFATLSPGPGASVEATFDILADGVGMVFRYQDPANHWGVRAVPSYGGWHIFKVVDGRETIERVLVGQALDGTRVGVQQSGDRFRVMLNGLVRSTIEDDALVDAPAVGLMAPAGDETARIESITVGRFDGDIALRSGDDEQDEIVPSLHPGGT
jgi:hypothetical protein